MYTAMESSSPSCLFGSSTLYSKPSTHSFDDSDLSDAEMHDDLADSAFVRVGSTEDDSSSQSEKADSPIMGKGLRLGAGLRDSRAMDVVDAESWKCSESGSLFKSREPWATSHPSDSRSSLVFNDKEAVSGFIFDPDLGFFGDDELDSSPSWSSPPWSPTPISIPRSAPTSTTRPIDIPMPVSATKPRLDRKRRKTGFFRDHIKLSFPRASCSSVQREETFTCSSPPPSTNHQPMRSPVMAEVVTYGDTSGRSTSWARRGRFGGRLSSRTRKKLAAFFTRKIIRGIHITGCILRRYLTTSCNCVVG